MSDRLAVLPQYLLPKQALTTLAGKFASARLGGLTTSVIRWFVGRYNVNMAEAANPDIASYTSFNDFFTRALKPGARPLAQADLICPVDGAISQFGPIAKDQVFQAKGHTYSTTALVGGDAAAAARFDNGHFATLYLSPRDYHRIHMPCAGELTRMVHVPGDLFSVNPTTARGVPGLFARNERVVCFFESAQGPFVLVLVGQRGLARAVGADHRVDLAPPQVHRDTIDGGQAAKALGDLLCRQQDFSHGAIPPRPWLRPAAQTCPAARAVLRPPPAR